MLSGWVVLDKPSGLTSTRAGSRVRKRFGVRKLGHVGTLDPMATGVLVLALGEATKLIPYLYGDAAAKTKSYRFEVTWGSATDTGDACGQVVAESIARPATSALESVCSGFVGALRQRPPIFSAVRINGERAYKLARRAEAFEVPERTVQINALKLESTAGADSAIFSVECSGGTYVRSLAVALAERLGVLGHVTMLRRMRDGRFSEADAISLENLENLSHNYEVKRVLPIGAVLGDIPAVTVLGAEEAAVRQGRALCSKADGLREGAAVRIICDGRLVAIAIMDGGVLRPKRVINYEGEKDVDN